MCSGSRSAGVAAMSHAVARRLAKVNPDTALLAGLLHGIGQLYILTRTAKHPELFENEAVYHNIVRDWHSSIAKALLENWDMAEEIVEAVGNYEDIGRTHAGPTDLTDVLTVGYLLASYREHPGQHRAQHGRASRPARACSSTAPAYDKLIKESGDEIAAVQAALGR